MRYAISTAVLVFAIALFAAIDPGSNGVAQQSTPEASPEPAATPIDPVTGEPIVADPLYRREGMTPASAFAYLGFWELRLAPGESIDVPAIQGTAMGHAEEGSVTLTPHSPSRELDDANVVEDPTDSGFLWPANTPLTVANEGSESALVLIAGLIDAQTPFPELNDPSDPGVTLLLQGGALVTNIPFQPVEISIAHFSFTSDMRAVFLPAAYPSIVSTIVNPLAVSMVPVDPVPGLVQSAIQQIDEPLEHVRVLDPTYHVTIEATADTSDFWVIGVEPAVSGIYKGCGGWKCLVADYSD